LADFEKHGTQGAEKLAISTKSRKHNAR
jgi:hypothetical protein